MAPGVSTDLWVKSYSHLKDRPKSKDALPFLQCVAVLVKPIMRKHNWMLPLLAEFFPKEDNLLGMNVNRGQKILLRLRPASSPDSFYEEEQVVLVMLHELTHNVHGPHDERFYKFLAGLEDEYEELKRYGYAGEGFHTKGNRLGSGAGSHDIPPYLAKTKALRAAEQRQRIGEMMSGGGRLGGGTKPRAGKTPRELAAEAAERRAQDAKACQSGHKAEHEANLAVKDSIIDLTVDEPYVWPDAESDSDVEFVEDAEPVAGRSKLSKLRRDVLAVEPSKLAQVATRAPASFALAQMRGDPTAGPSDHPVQKRPDIMSPHPSLPTTNSHSKISETRSRPSSQPRAPAAIASSSRPRAHAAAAPYPKTKPEQVEKRGDKPKPSTAMAEDEELERWACPACTLVNTPMALQCSVCRGLRPASA